MQADTNVKLLMYERMSLDTPLCPEMTLIRCTLNFDIQHKVSL